MIGYDYRTESQVSLLMIQGGSEEDMPLIVRLYHFGDSTLTGRSESAVTESILPEEGPTTQGVVKS